MKKVPFVDLQRQHKQIRDDLNNAIKKVIDSGVYISGNETKKFESQFTEFVGVKYGVGCSSGTSALQLALSGYGIKHGDEVITTTMTFIATAEAISAVGAKPVFVDIEKQNYNIDPVQIEKVINAKTKAIIVVHLYGQSADMGMIMELGNKYNIKIIEDAAQAHGAYYNDKMLGSIGDVACFSFFPGKNLGAFGDAGIVVCNDLGLAEKIRMLRDHGRTAKYKHDIVGLNHRIDEIQAAILKVKLKGLLANNSLRQNAAKFYDNSLHGISNDLILPFCPKYSKHSYHLYVVRCTKRDELMNHCINHGINVGIHYPVPLHLQPAYSSLGYKIGDFPIAEEAARTVLSLPMFPGITNEELEYTVEVIKMFF